MTELSNLLLVQLLFVHFPSPLSPTFMHPLILTHLSPPSHIPSSSLIAHPPLCSPQAQCVRSPAGYGD